MARTQPKRISSFPELHSHEYEYALIRNFTSAKEANRSALLTMTTQTIKRLVAITQSNLPKSLANVPVTDCFWMLVSLSGAVLYCSDMTPDNIKQMLSVSDAEIKPNIFSPVLEGESNKYTAEQIQSNPIFGDYFEYLSFIKPLTPEGSKQPFAALGLFIKKQDIENNSALCQCCDLVADQNAKIVSKSFHLAISTREQAISENMLTTVFSLLEGYILFVSSDGVISNYSNATRQLLSMPEDHLTKYQLRDFIKNKTQVSSLLSGGSFNNYSVNVQTNSGEKVFSAKTRPIYFDTKDKSAGYLIQLTSTPETYNEDDSLPHDLITFETIAKNCPSMTNIISRISVISSTDANVLLLGETGTGKDTFAAAIHNAHYPQGAPFIALNCAGLSVRYAEETLFGVERSDYISEGRIEQANNGTLYLDEIGDLPLTIQGLLLRVLDDKAVMRVGSSKIHPAKFRLICTTRKNLAELVEDGLFREDLYYRISVAQVKLLPLRERKEDIIPLAQHVLQRYCETRHIRSIKMNQDVKRILEQYDWPGNIRQLRTCINYACDLCADQTLTVNDLPEVICESVTGCTNTPALSKNWLLEDNQRQMIINALIETNNDVPAAAKLLGIGRSTLYKRLKQYKASSN